MAMANRYNFEYHRGHFTVCQSGSEHDNDADKCSRISDTKQSASSNMDGTMLFSIAQDIHMPELFQDLFQSHITSISQCLNQPQCNRLAKFLTWIRMMHMNKA